MTHDEIYARSRAIDKERRDAVSQLVESLAQKHKAERKELMDACEAIGHKWRFTHLGPTGVAWSICTICNKSKTE